MSTGVFGNIRPSDVLIEDIDVFYTYMPNRETLPTDVFRLDSNSIISYTYLPIDEQEDNQENLLEGVYNLTLPATEFNLIGIYNIYIRPKAIPLNIVDCGVLSALPTVKGIIIDGNAIDSRLRANNALQGYKIEYINQDGTKLRNTVRYVVSSNKVIPVTENIGNTSQTAIRYRFDDSGNLIFLQVTPSSASNVKANLIPFIGSPNQKIIMSNTSFNPLMYEVEMVENDIESLVDYVAGEQIKDVSKGKLSHYNRDREIVKQFDLYVIKDSVNNVPLFEVKQNSEIIDVTQDFDTITDI